jgi:GT2 family glycosyltransferase
VIVPFRAGAGAAERLGRALARLRLGAGDQVIVADNSDRGVAGALLGGAVRVVSAAGERSSYHARNVGAAAAAGEWLLFCDADCAPAADLIDAYFAEEPGAGCGALAGQVRGDPDQRAFAARYARSRRFLDQYDGLHDAGAGAAATANLVVRRIAFEQVRGFAEGIRSGGDFDLCRRLLDAGWAIEARPGAVVHHRHRESVPDLLGAIARYGSGARWLNRRYPGSAPRWPLGHGLAGCARDIPKLIRQGRVEEASFRALDGVGLLAHNLGYARSNVVERR